MTKNSVVLQNSPANGRVNSGSKICRICHEDDRSSSETIISSPCKCTGTLGHVHKSCMEQWIRTRRRVSCELCRHPIPVVKIYKDWFAWFWDPNHTYERKDFLLDFLQIAVLTVMIILLYINGVKYSSRDPVGWSGVLFVSLCLFELAFIMYTFWYHYRVFKRWKMMTAAIYLDLKTARQNPRKTSAESIAGKGPVDKAVGAPCKAPEERPQQHPPAGVRASQENRNQHFAQGRTNNLMNENRAPQQINQVPAPTTQFYPNDFIPVWSSSFGKNIHKSTDAPAAIPSHPLKERIYNVALKTASNEFKRHSDLVTMQSSKSSPKEFNQASPSKTSFGPNFISDLTEIVSTVDGEIKPVSTPEMPCFDPNKVIHANSDTPPVPMEFKHTNISEETRQPHGNKFADSNSEILPGPKLGNWVSEEILPCPVNKNFSQQKLMQSISEQLSIPKFDNKVPEEMQSGLTKPLGPATFVGNGKNEEFIECACGCDCSQDSGIIT